MTGSIFKSALILVLAAPWIMGCASVTHAEGIEVALKRKVMDAERGVRAIITYRPNVPTGGETTIVAEDGTETTMHWDGFAGQFTAEITQGHMTEADSKTFLKEAVIVVCPSVDRDLLEKEWVQVTGPFRRVFAQCPELDATRK